MDIGISLKISEKFIEFAENYNKDVLEVRISVSIVSNKQYESKQHRNNKHKICRPFKTLFRLEQNIFACYSPNKV